MKLGIRLWDIPCIKRFYAQDNDESEDGDESDDERKKKGEETNSSISLEDEISQHSYIIGTGPKKHNHIIYMT